MIIETISYSAHVYLPSYFLKFVVEFVLLHGIFNLVKNPKITTFHALLLLSDDSTLII